MRFVLPFVLLIAAVLPSAAVAIPAAQTTDVAIVSADIGGGGLLAGACYVINGASIEGCDENGDGQVDFRGVVPGTYLVTQTRAPSGYFRAGDFPVAIAPGGTAIFAAFLAPTLAGGGAFDIAVAAVDQFSNTLVPGACFVLNGGSIEGCDENGDGMVDFRGVRAGTYLVTETRAPSGYRAPDDAWIAVTAATPKIVGLLQVPAGGIGAGVSANTSASVQNRVPGALPPQPYSALTPRCTSEPSGDAVAVTDPTGESIRVPVARPVTADRVLAGGCR